MWDDVIELVLELILDGATEIVKARRVPMWVRVLAAVLLAAAYVAVAGLLLWATVESGEAWLTGLAVFGLILFTAFAVARVVRHLRKEEE